MTDEELAKLLFLEENEGANLSHLSLLAEEEKFYNTQLQQDVEAGLAKKVEEIPRPKQKGVTIKEVSNPDQSLPVRKVYSVEEFTSKGKGKIDEHLEKGMLSMKATTDKAQVAEIQTRSTTNVTHVDQDEMKKSITDSAHIDSAEKGKSNSDDAKEVIMKNYKPTVLSDEMKLKFTSNPVLHHREKIEKENPADLLLKQKIAFDKGGLGSGRENWYDTQETNTRDPSTLADLKKGITQQILDKLESAQLVKVRGESTHLLLYFLNDGTIFKVTNEGLKLKENLELEYILYILRVSSQATFKYANMIREILHNRRISLRKITGPFRPKSLNTEGKEVEMRRNSSKFETIDGVRVLTFNEESKEAHYIRLGNDIGRNSIYSLRSAIFQTGNDDGELSEVRAQMMEALLEAENRLLRDYLSKQWHLEAIQD